YAKPIIILYLLTALIGAVIYPSYRIGIRPILEQVHFNKPLGLFELKEHFIAIGFALLPVYWYLWRQPKYALDIRAIGVRRHELRPRPAARPGDRSGDRIPAA